MRELHDNFARLRADPARGRGGAEARRYMGGADLGVRDAVTQRTGATAIDKSVNDLRDQAEREVRVRLGADRWNRAYAAGRRMSNRFAAERNRECSARIYDRAGGTRSSEGDAHTESSATTPMITVVPLISSSLDRGARHARHRAVASRSHARPGSGCTGGPRFPSRLWSLDTRRLDPAG